MNDHELDQAMAAADQPMTGPEHYREAEKLLAAYRTYREHRKGAMFTMTPLWLSEALVHAHLASSPHAPAERLTRCEPGGDWPQCLCGNTPDMDGFPCSRPDGTPIEDPGPGSGWDGVLLVCAKCGRIFDQHTLIVTGRRDPWAG